jgi:hypothetical protein
MDIGTTSFTLEAHDQQPRPTCQSPEACGTDLGSSL